MEKKFVDELMRNLPVIGKMVLESLGMDAVIDEKALSRFIKEKIANTDENRGNADRRYFYPMEKYSGKMMSIQMLFVIEAIKMQLINWYEKMQDIIKEHPLINRSESDDLNDELDKYYKELKLEDIFTVNDMFDRSLMAFVHSFNGDYDHDNMIWETEVITGILKGDIADAVKSDYEKYKSDPNTVPDKVKYILDFYGLLSEPGYDFEKEVVRNMSKLSFHDLYALTEVKEIEKSDYKDLIYHYILILVFVKHEILLGKYRDIFKEEISEDEESSGSDNS